MILSAAIGDIKKQTKIEKQYYELKYIYTIDGYEYVKDSTYVKINIEDLDVSK